MAEYPVTQDFYDAKEDLRTIDAVANGRDPDTGDPIATWETRLGDIVGTVPSKGDDPRVYSIAGLQAVTPSEGLAIYLSFGGRSGTFVWTLGDFTTQVAADTQQGIYIASASVAVTVGCWVRKLELPEVCPIIFSDDTPSSSTDFTDAIQAAIDSGYPVNLGPYSYGYTYINAGAAKITGAGTQKTKLYYLGDPEFVGTTFKYTSGAVLLDFRLLGPFSEVQDVGDDLIGLSTNDGLSDTTAQNRVKVNNVRVESFATNVYARNLQNSDFHDIFSQYAKNNEYYLKGTENCWLTKVNGNSLLSATSESSIDVGVYKLLRLEGNRNLRFKDGIFERAHTAETPYIIDGGSAEFSGVEFNGSDELENPLISAINGANVKMITPAFTLTGVDKIVVETDSTSYVSIDRPSSSGLGGNNLFALTRGNVSDGTSKDCAISFLGDRPNNVATATSGGVLYDVDSSLVITGDAAPAGAVIYQSLSNNAWLKELGDSVAGLEFTIRVAEISGVSEYKLYAQLGESPWRRVLGVYTEAGTQTVSFIPEEGESISSLGVGVTWDGVTTDATYGDVGVLTLLGASIKVFR